MTPWWRNLIEKHNLVPTPAEPAAVQKLPAELSLQAASIRAEFWSTVQHEVPAVDFSDLVVTVRDDMSDDVAYLLTWILVDTRAVL